MGASSWYLEGLCQRVAARNASGTLWVVGLNNFCSLWSPQVVIVAGDGSCIRDLPLLLNPGRMSLQDHQWRMQEAWWVDGLCEYLQGHPLCDGDGLACQAKLSTVTVCMTGCVPPGVVGVT